MNQIRQDDVQRSGDRYFTRALDLQRFGHQHLAAETSQHHQQNLTPGEPVVWQSKLVKLVTDAVTGYREIKEYGGDERPARQVQHQNGVMYFRALPHDDDVQRREEGGQDGAQIPHKVVALSTMHLEERKINQEVEGEDSLAFL